MKLKIIFIYHLFLPANIAQLVRQSNIHELQDFKKNPNNLFRLIKNPNLIIDGHNTLLEISLKNNDFILAKELIISGAKVNNIDALNLQHINCLEESLAQIKKNLLSKKNIKNIKEIYKNLFDIIFLINNLDQKKSKLKIPFLIHQIWIGPNPLPEKYKSWSKSWIKNHPNWQYKLWGNNDLDEFNLKDNLAYQSATNWGQKSDILRYEILKKYGGLYIDTDFESIKSLENFHYKFNFYCGRLRENDEEVANGIIACAPNHPIITKCIDEIKKIKIPKHNGPYAIFDQTGPWMFTRVIIDFCINQKTTRIGIMPHTIFFPFPSNLRDKFKKNLISKEQLMKFITPESFAIHYWESSWLK